MFWQFLADHKGVLAGTATLIGIMKNLSNALQSRSLESASDGLLARIKTLTDADKFIATASGGDAANPAMEEARSAVRAQLSSTISRYVETSRRLHAKRALTPGLGPLQRIFLLYRPHGVRGWLAQLLFWSLATCIPLFLFGLSLQKEGQNISYDVFVTNWKQGDTWGGFLLLMSAVLFSRLWAVWEHKRYQAKNIAP